MLSRLFQIHYVVLIAALCIASSGRASAIEILRNVPENALGFAVVQNLGRVDARVSHLLDAMDLKFPGPLALLRATTGIGDGLDPSGDMLIAVLRGPGTSERPLFAVWLPVNDYPRFLNSLQGASQNDRVTAVTVAGEDLLIAQHGQWALLMDPTERTRMEQMLAAAPNEKPRFNRWESWMGANDVTAAILPRGVRTLVSWAMAPVGVKNQSDSSGDAGDEGDLFEPVGERGDQVHEPAAGVASVDGPSSAARRAIRRWIREMPKFMLWAIHTDAIACGIRLDDAGNAVAGARWSWRPGPGVEVDVESNAPAESAAMQLFQGGEFIASGQGSVPDEFSVEAAGMYAKWLVRGLEQDNRTKLDGQATVQFVEAMKSAADSVESAAVLTRPGDEKNGVYTNNFLAVRVASADEFIDRGREVMRTWNELNYDLQGEMKLVFDSQSIPIDGREAVEYSIDMAAAVGTPGLPEVRQAMEKLFGPDGKLRLVFCPVDEQTVLMATGTADQATTVVKTLTRQAEFAEQWPEFEPAAQLLPREGAWRLYMSPHGYTNWLRRQMDAVLGPVLGGPVVKEFPASPPLGAVGGFADHEAWVDIGAPVDTIKSAAAYLKK